MSLPGIIVSSWVFLLVKRWSPLPLPMVVGVAVILTMVILSVFCIVWVWSQKRDEEN